MRLRWDEIKEETTPGEVKAEVTQAARPHPAQIQLIQERLLKITSMTLVPPRMQVNMSPQ